MFHSDNVYEIPNVRVKGKVCFTNFTSNTAFRGFGGPQGMLIAENWIERIAMEVKKSPEEIRVSYWCLMKLLFQKRNWKWLCFITLLFLTEWYVSVQEINFLKEGSILHYSQKIENFTLGRLWKELKVSSNYSKARKQVEEFNRHNRWKKRGIAMIPTKFGISFTSKFMNQVTFSHTCLYFSVNYCFCFWKVKVGCTMGLINSTVLWNI